ncbi:MAG: bifunctional diguanylate cyclase/phosphodiesterase [Solobacterium sp.]|jgi:diguanylate cyclase (GGDEF)-like protein|nr:bifunctional diguanylate cyclase/phosphodiesterase [Solobacterium sp.]MCH4048546.1 bifunctional diguanylate cyclase/phosphodiesterase [Solobacterium sp.]MCH4074604.1 bifunctional diguanylate cyclase/phosphodiesterase [Solobacterium sp.]
MYSADYAIIYLAVEILCFSLIAVMGFKMNGNVGAVDEVNLFRRLSVCGMIQIISECVWMLNWSLLPGITRPLLYLVCLGDLICTGYLVCFWYMFVDIKVTPRYILEKRNGMIDFMRVLPIIILTVMDVSSLWNRGVFYLDASGAYVRGPLYPVHCIFCYLYYIPVLYLLWKSRRHHHVNAHDHHLYIIFSTLLVIGGVFQILIGKAPFSMLFFTLGMFVIFSSLQSQQIDTDALTKLNNHGRGIALVKMHLADAEKEPFYLFMADINGFKKINDNYGHILGDEALLLTADALQRLLAPYHTGFLARFGGDEFMFGIDQNEAEPKVVMEHFAQLLSEVLEASDLSFRFTLSVGCALANQDDMSPETLIAEADHRLYVQKRELYDAAKPSPVSSIAKTVTSFAVPSAKGIPGKYANAKKSENAAQLALSGQEMADYVLSHIDEALQKGWIVPYFQPVVRTITDRLTGAEALARWEDPVYGTIMPSVFVPVLEKAGLIYRIDCFMYTSACRIQKQRLEAALAVQPISVNLSRQDFEKKDMVDFVTEEADRYGISHDLIALEITESVLVQNKEKMTAVVRQLREAGFEVWMDDFGSGYSSLIFLNDYTLDVIKLDMAFLRSFSKASKEIMKSAVDMAKRLGIRTLAEGVETAEHVAFLKEIGCDMMQGYYFAKPLKMEDMEKYLLRMHTSAETIAWKGFYDKADACVVDTDVPRAVMEYDVVHDRIRYLFINSREKQQLRGLGRTSAEESAAVLNNRNNPLHARLRTSFRQAVKSGERVTTYVVDNSCVLRVGIRLVTAQAERCIVLTSVTNVTKDRQQQIVRVLDKSLSDIALLFDDVHVLNPNQDTAESLVNNFGIDRGYGNDSRLRDGLIYFKTHLIYPDDQERYWTFADPDTMLTRLRETPDGILRAFFRVLLPDENGRYVYMWKEFNLMAVPGSDDKRVLSCIKSIQPTTEDRVFMDLMKQAELEPAASEA